MGQDREDRQSRDLSPQSHFQAQLDEDRRFERAVSRRMIVTWLAVAALIAAWYLVESIYR